MNFISYVFALGAAINKDEQVIKILNSALCSEMSLVSKAEIAILKIKDSIMNEKLLKSIAISLALIASCQMGEHSVPDEMKKKRKLDEAVRLINEVS